MEMEFIMIFGIKLHYITLNSKFSDKRDIEFIVEGKVGNVKRRVSDFSKDYGLQGLMSFICLIVSPRPSSIP
jgi:hypothetical protein